MILQEIHFRKGEEVLYIKREIVQSEYDNVPDKDTIMVVRNGKQILCIEAELASLVGDCLRHMGSETDFLGIKERL